MARLVLLTILLVAAALANESPNKPEESEFQQEMLKNLNKTNEKLDRLMRIVFEQEVQTRKVAEQQKEELIRFSNVTNERLDQLAKNVNQRLDQVLEKDKEMEEKRKNDREKLDALANITERHIQFFQIRFPPHCNLARSSKLTMLSNGKIYSFHPTYENWNSANETCVKKGLHLATITDLNEATLVAAEAKRIKKGTGWWVSAKNQASGSAKDFRWNDGSKLELDSPLWEENADKRYDCIHTYNWPKGKLYSHSCNSDQPFICELPSECY
ncbi:C-type lectin domain family 4 member F-like [Neocloeon triangulifer]|uniref:C-type lectin domain family 4 member F-like n=1 Tax=Neocloeon triangulifer TaxID=2078957 RepID=UPI00286F0109|nr:C-type lectin domain family 4 member F-like [Neocloeon triangulifer]